MDFRYNEADDHWRQHVRSFLRREITPDLLADLRSRGETHSPALWKRLGEEGWLGLGWPRAFGGQERGQWELMIFEEEIVLAGCPLSTQSMLGTTVGQLGGMVIRHGSDDQQREWLPAISRGELTCGEGLSEPNAGSDLAGLETRAVRDGDDWILNGSKIFNQAHLTTHFLVLARTDPALPRHRGLTFFLVDMSNPGVSISPLKTLGGWRRNVVYFEDVRIPAGALVGGLNRGWYQFIGPHTGQSFQVRLLANMRLVMDDLLAFVQHEERDGEPLRALPWVRDQIASLAADLEAAELLTRYVVWRNTRGEEAAAPSSMAKIATSELQERLFSAAMDILGPWGALESWGEERNGVPLRGRLAQLYRDVRLWFIAGGTGEIKRTIIAQRGFGLPRD